MRVAIEKTFLTTTHGTRILLPKPTCSIVEATNLHDAVIAFIEADRGRLLGSVIQVTETRAIATAWVNDQVYLIAAEPAAD
jgi:hypothetical protein